MDGSAELECAEFGIRADSGVLGTELRGGESGFSSVETCKPLFAELSIRKSATVLCRQNGSMR